MKIPSWREELWGPIKGRTDSKRAIANAHSQVSGEMMSVTFSLIPDN